MPVPVQEVRKSASALGYWKPREEPPLHYGASYSKELGVGAVLGDVSCLYSSSGHEAAFAAFLCCLCKIGVLRVDDQVAIVFKVFDR